MKRTRGGLGDRSRRHGGGRQQLVQRGGGAGGATGSPKPCARDGGGVGPGNRRRLSLENGAAAAPPITRRPGRRIEAFLQDCRHCLTATAPAAQDLDPRIDAAEKLRREGLRLLGEAEGAKLDDPARVRLSHAAGERERVREAVDALGVEVRGLRSRAFIELGRSVARQGLDAHCDPVDLPAWASLRDRAEALRGEASLAADAREAVDAVLARDARVNAEIAPVKAFLEEGARHLNRRVALDEEGRGTSPDTIPAWRERSRDLRETALNLLGESPADTGDMQAAARLADMPRLQGRVREVLDRLETLELRDEVAEFQKLAATVERRARRQKTLPLYAEGYGRATEMAQTLTSRTALPEAARHEAAAWLDRDRSWKEDLASALKLTASQQQDVDVASLSEALRETLSEALRETLSETLREAGRLPAVRAAIGQETARLARSQAPEHWTAWTGDEPLIAGDRIAWRADGTVHHAAVAFPGDAGGMRASDTLLLRIAGPADGTAPDDAGRMVEMRARDLQDAGCARAEWSDEGLRQLEAARQYSVPSAACPLACPEPVAGDRIAWTEAAGRSEEVRTVEAVVATKTETPDGHELALRVIRASGPRARGARRLDRAGRRGDHRARLLPRLLVRRGPAGAHTRPAEGGPGADPEAEPWALPRRRNKYVRCGNQRGRRRLAVRGCIRGCVRGRAQRRSTEQRRLARHPLPELPFDEEVERLLPTQLRSERNRSIRPNTVNLKAMLRQIDPDDGNPLQECLLLQGVEPKHRSDTLRCRREQESTPSRLHAERKSGR